MIHRGLPGRFGILVLVLGLDCSLALAQDNRPEGGSPETNVPLPQIRFLTSPPDGGTIESGSIRFEWDGRDLRREASHFRLIVKERSPDQSADEAMLANDVRFETEIEHLDFFVLDAAELQNPFARHVWQVTAFAEAGGQLTAIAISEARTFRLESREIDFDTVFGPGGALPPVLELQADMEEARRANDACPDGDFESGTLQGWQAFYGSRLNSPYINLSNLTLGVIDGRHTIRNLADGNDPELLPSVLLPQVSEGNFAVRLGNSESTGAADVLAYTFVVTEQNKNFTFRYALVLENPTGHGSDQQPFFVYFVRPQSSIFPVMGQRIVADSNNPFFKTQGGIVYREWTPTCLDLSRYLDQVVTIYFATADCSLGGHYGYAYLDGLCLSNAAVASFTLPSEICASDQLLADGSASSNETSFFWSIEESDANFGRNPSTEVSQWFVAQQAGPINLTEWYASKGGQFKCNTYYRIKLAVSNDCTGWNESVRLLHVKCPPITAGPDLCVSCTPDGGTSQLGAGNPTTGLIYLWSPTAGLDSHFSPSPTHTHGSVSYPATYTVRAANAEGCVNTDQVRIHCQPPTLEIHKVNQCCGATLTAMPTGHETITWSTGESDTLSIDVASPGTYSATVTNPCGSVTQSIEVEPANGLSGFFNPIAANSRFCPPSGAPNCEANLHIKDVVTGNGAAGIPNAYNATEYRLEIFNEWGEQFRTITGQSCDGFPNWSIAWDGTHPSGELVQQEVYNWRVLFKNCQYRNWRLPKVRKFVERKCVRWARFIGFRLWCREYNVPPGTTVDEELTAEAVTVIR